MAKKNILTWGELMEVVALIRSIESNGIVFNTNMNSVSFDSKESYAPSELRSIASKMESFKNTVRELVQTGKLEV